MLAEPSGVSKAPRTPTARELDILSVLWRDGSGTVNDIRAQLSDELSYTTVLSVLQTLEHKGFVRHTKEGRAYRYIPAIAPEEPGRTVLSRILDKIFHGSAEVLLAQLVQEHSFSVGELHRMRALLDAQLHEHDEANRGDACEEGDASSQARSRGSRTRRVR